MARYIDADTLKNDGRLCWNDDKGNIYYEIDHAPTADVVKVVRCKDCKHNKYEQPNGFIHCHRDIKEGWIFRRTTDYCSYGERKCE